MDSGDDSFGMGNDSQALDLSHNEGGKSGYLSNDFFTDQNNHRD